MNSSLLKNQQTLNPRKINDSIPVKKIRIIVSDPYATESSSDDEEHRRRRRRRPTQPADAKNSSPPSPKRRRIIHEIFLPFNDDTAAGGEKSSTEEGSSVESTTTPPPALKRFRGVRQRKSGSWSAEIRDPFKKRRVFLGTFGTGEEASRAYEDKKMEFRERLEAQSAMDRTRPTECGSGTDSSSLSGEQIEQIEAAKVLGSILIDNNGFLLGEFSNLDDDLTIPD